MPHYTKRGSIPHKRHTQFRKPDGSLYAEELVSTEGFHSVYSLIYHLYPPTLVSKIGAPIDVNPKLSTKNNMQNRCYKGFNVAPVADYLQSRVPVLVNSDVHVVLAAPKQSTKDYFYKNSDADEVIFVHEGTGTMKSIFGELKFGYGDYIVIPRGTIYQLEFDSDKNRLFIVESFSPIQYPKRYRNEYGQLLEHSPFCERDIREPENLT
ncbi:MAG: homogentisate 1,2-dioxygenase, partial [Chitinophagales bacterium]|nr:homogentisate 1,2-dioxygenase [Chitinophagales bacterium]